MKDNYKKKKANFYKRDILCAFLELFLQIPIGILGVLNNRKQLNPYLFIITTFVLQVLVLTIIARSTKISIQSDDHNKILINHICQSLQDKINNLNIPDSRKQSVTEKVSKLKREKYFINFKGIKIGNSGKANFAALILMIAAVGYAALSLLAPILWHHNMIGRRQFASCMLMALICGVIIPILFRAVGAIGSRNTIQTIKSIDELSNYVNNLPNDNALLELDNKKEEEKCLLKILNYFKDNKIYYQEISMAVFEIVVSLLLGIFIFMHSSNRMNPWLFAYLSCLGKIIVLYCIMRVLDYNFKSSDDLDDLVYRLNDKKDKTNPVNNNHSEAQVILSDGSTLSPLSKRTGKLMQEKGKYAIFAFQSSYIMLSTATDLLYQYKYIDSIKLHMALSIVSFFLGTMSMIAFRLVLNINFHNNIDSIDEFKGMTINVTSVEQERQNSIVKS